MAERRPHHVDRALVPRSRRQRMVKVLGDLPGSFAERMTYRGDFLLGTLLRFLPMVTTILLWQAIYKGSGKTELAGFG